MEGPFGEFTTLYGKPMMNPIIDITAITTRKNPIYLDIFSGHIDHQLLGGTPRLSSIHRAVQVACPTVKDIFMPPPAAAVSPVTSRSTRGMRGRPRMPSVPPLPWIPSSDMPWWLTRISISLMIQVSWAPSRHGFEWRRMSLSFETQKATRSIPSQGRCFWWTRWGSMPPNPSRIILRL